MKENSMLVIIIETSFSYCSTVKCFKWKTKSCVSTQEPEFCELDHRRDEELFPSAGDTTVAIQSPLFERLRDRPPSQQAFGKQYFCLYNVSLSCTSGRVAISSTQRTTWAGNATDCRNYVAFYTNSSSSDLNVRYCGGSQRKYMTELDSDSFIAVMWSDEKMNRGLFEFVASCREELATQPPSTTEGSGSQIGSGQPLKQISGLCS